MKTFLRPPKRDVERIVKHLPLFFGNYYEPFLWSGDVFFNLFNHGRVFKKAYLSTSNRDIVRTYLAVADEPERIEKMVLHYCQNNSKDFYDSMLNATATPSSFIYCNRASKPDGKWRESQFIDMNREIGKNIDDIGRCSRYINRWCESIWVSHWDKALTGVSSGDVVWLEPPLIANTLDGRIDYVKDCMNESDHVYMNNFCVQLANKGAKVFMLQSNTAATHRIFGDKFNLNLVENRCLYEW